MPAAYPGRSAPRTFRRSTSLSAVSVLVHCRRTMHQPVRSGSVGYYKVVSIAALLRSLALRACTRTKAGCNLCSGRASGYAGNRRSARHRGCCHFKGSASSQCPSSTPGTSAPPPTTPESTEMRDLQLERVKMMAQLLRCAQSVAAGFPLILPTLSVSRDGPQAQRRWSRPLLYVET